MFPADAGFAPPSSRNPPSSPARAFFTTITLPTMTTIHTGRSSADLQEALMGVLNGIVGDLLDERQSGLAIPMTFRCQGAAVTLDRRTLADQLTGATGAVCLFVPGLMSSDAVWRFPGQGATTYGSRLAADR